jgi:hypothetical protein
MRAVGLLGKALEDGQRKPGGLAGAGLGGAQKVFAGEDDGDGLRLDGGGLCVALFRDSAEQLRAKPERIERIANWNFSCTRPVKGLPSTGSGRCFLGLFLSGPGWTAKNGLRR